MIRQRLDALRPAIADALAKRDPEVPGWIYAALTHSQDELEEVIDYLESNPADVAGAEGIAVRAEIALDVHRSRIRR
jgi:hypothetical protein